MAQPILNKTPFGKPILPMRHYQTKIKNNAKWKVNMNKTSIIKSCLTPLSVAISLAISPQVTAQQNDKNATETIEVIEIKGMKASVTKALNMKRFEVGVSDAISADDIASFPDENIAESIQRIPGIQIQRSNGRGSLISIRGLGPEFTATTLNGQAFASAQFDGGFRFDIVQSELASEIQVFKTPNASIEEGGLSGTVNIGTAKPLDFKERKVLVKAEANYSEDKGSTTPGAGFTYIDQLQDGKLGVLFNAAYQELDTRYDLMFSQRFSDVDSDNNGESDFVNGIPVERTNRPRLRREDGNTKRYLLNGSLQYIANDDLEFSLTGILAQDERVLNFQQLVPLFGGGTPSPVLTLNGQTGNTVDQILAENIRVEANHTLQTEDRTSYAITGDMNYNINEQLSLYGALHYTAGEIEKVERAIVLGIRTDLEVDMDVNNPVFTSNGLNPVSDPDSWALDNLFRNDIAGKVETFDTDELALQLDLTYDVEHDFINTVKVGFKHREQSLNTQSTRFDRNYRDADIYTAPFPTVAEASTVVRDFSGGEFPGLSLNFVLPDVHAYLTQFDASGDTISPNFQEASFFEIDRAITNLYAQVDFSGDNFRGNVGIRYAKTDRTVNTVTYDGGITVTTGAFTDIGGDSATPSRNDFDYDNVLPSVNLAYDLTEDVVLRLAVGKVLVRPVIGETASFGREIATQDDGTNIIVNVSEGSFDLPALTANQFDFSAEWYFNESSALSVALFRKDIKNQVATETVCPANFALADLTVNAISGECVGTNDGYVYNISRNRITNGVLKINGIELAYNQSFDFLPEPFNGLGVIANYTILDADNPNEEQPLLGSSENTYNLIGYYENGGFAMRIALNNRSEYTINNSFSGDNFGPSNAIIPNPNSLLDARNQIDFTISYQFETGTKVALEGININGDFERGTRFEGARLQQLATFGSTYFLGVTHSF